jgi:hypothetical protein
MVVAVLDRMMLLVLLSLVQGLLILVVAVVVLHLVEQERHLHGTQQVMVVQD